MAVALATILVAFVWVLSQRTAAWYVAFGRAVGSDGKDLHGAGAVRFDTKIAGATGGERYYNFVRLVREAK